MIHVGALPRLLVCGHGQPNNDDWVGTAAASSTAGWLVRRACVALPALMHRHTWSAALMHRHAILACFSSCRQLWSAPSMLRPGLLLCLPRRLYADASMEGQHLLADSCRTTGDTVLTVLASPHAAGGSWTFCDGNDGGWMGSAAGWGLIVSKIKVCKGGTPVDVTCPCQVLPHAIAQQDRQVTSEAPLCRLLPLPVQTAAAPLPAPSKWTSLSRQTNTTSSWSRPTTAPSSRPLH